MKKRDMMKFKKVLEEQRRELLKANEKTLSLAKQAHGAATVRYDDTILLGTVVTGTPRAGIDFFPLTVDFREKLSAAGKFPGGFFKREGRPPRRIPSGHDFRYAQVSTKRRGVGPLREQRSGLWRPKLRAPAHVPILRGPK